MGTALTMLCIANGPHIGKGENATGWRKTHPNRSDEVGITFACRIARED